jgi:methyl-accepting chemotaxis protein
MNKRVSVVFFSLFLAGAFLHAEAADIEVIGSLSAPHSLQKGWRYSYEDKDGSRRDFAEAGFDDSGWASVDLPYPSFSFDKDKSRYIWFRKKFRVDPGLRGRLIGLEAGKFPNVTAVYMNGVLIGTAGSMPPRPYDVNTSIPFSFLIPDGLIRFGADNVVAYKMYGERYTGSLKDPSLMDNDERKTFFRLEYFLNTIAPMIVTVFCLFLGAYYLLLFIRRPTEKFHLFISLGCLTILLYFTGIYKERYFLGITASVKLCTAALYWGVLLFVFYFQSFFRVHDNRTVRWILAAVTALFTFLLWIQPDLDSAESFNGGIVQLALVSPLLLYNLFLCIVALVRGNRYARILVVGIVIVISAGLRDIMLVFIKVQPMTWSSSMGMAFFILSTFLSSSMHTANVQKESEDTSDILLRQKDALKGIFQDIKAIGGKVSESGEILDRSISEATASVEEMVRSNDAIRMRAKSQAATMEKNSATITSILSSFDETAVSADGQAKVVAESTGSIRKVIDSIGQVNDATEKTRELSGNLARVAEGGKRAVGESSDAIGEIEESSRNVRGIVTSISDIAEQTNLLAMNAAIEAVHAGHYGRGFAVVAKEVRALAADASRSSGKIMDQIEEMSRKIVNGVEVFANVQNSLLHIIDGIGETIGLINGISSASTSQEGDIERITASIKALVASAENVKTQTASQRTESEKIRASLNELMKVAREIEMATEEQNAGGKDIIRTVENITAISGQNKGILEKLDAMIGVFEKTLLT